jgi:hypothetical protein
MSPQTESPVSDFGRYEMGIIKSETPGAETTKFSMFGLILATTFAMSGSFRAICARLEPRRSDRRGCWETYSFLVDVRAIFVDQRPFSVKQESFRT